MTKAWTQNDEVLERLAHGSLTPKDAITFGCFRLAARVYELRQDGHNIVTMREGDGDRQYARYVLVHHAPGGGAVP